MPLASELSTPSTSRQATSKRSTAPARETRFQQRHNVSKWILRHLEMHKLTARAGTLRASYASAIPFPHMYLDGLFPTRLFKELSDEFPEPQASLLGQWGTCILARLKGWQCIVEPGEGYLEITNMNERTMGPRLQGLMSALKDPVFVSFLEELTGIAPLLADPTNEGSGQRQTLRGGSLQIHADFNELQLPSEPLRYRRVIIFLYLNEEWNTSWRGDLELWHRNMVRLRGANRAGASPSETAARGAIEAQARTTERDVAGDERLRERGPPTQLRAVCCLDAEVGP